MTKRTLILASGSPQRRQLLEQAGYDFVIVPPEDHVECGVCSTGGPAALVAELAALKLANVVRRLSDENRIAEAAVVACDTVAECRGQILGKPTSEDHARQMLQSLRGTVHRVYSGLAVYPLPVDFVEHDLDANARIDVAISEIEMQPISVEQLEAYLASNLWQGKAGAFGFQDRQGWLHLRSGSESNVIGLPLELLQQMLTRLD